MKKSLFVFKGKKPVVNKVNVVKIAQFEECWECGCLPCKCK